MREEEEGGGGGGGRGRREGEEGGGGEEGGKEGRGGREGLLSYKTHTVMTCKWCQGYMHMQEHTLCENACLHTLITILQVMYCT